MVEVGNIMISTFINALSGLADLTIQVTVPAFAVDMQGAILIVPMAEFGGQSDYIMTIGANFICNRRIVPAACCSHRIPLSKFFVEEAGCFG